MTYDWKHRTPADQGRRRARMARRAARYAWNVFMAALSVPAAYSIVEAIHDATTGDRFMLETVPEILAIMWPIGVIGYGLAYSIEGAYVHVAPREARTALWIAVCCGVFIVMQLLLSLVSFRSVPLDSWLNIGPLAGLLLGVTTLRSGRRFE